MLRNRATRADGTQFDLRQAFKRLEGCDIEGVQAIRVFARVPNLDRDIRMLLASVMVIVIVGFVSIVGVVFVGMIVVGIVLIGVIIVGAVIVGMIIVGVVLIGIVFFLHGGGHVPIDVHLDHSARSVRVQQNEIPHVVE